MAFREAEAWSVFRQPPGAIEPEPVVVAHLLEVLSGETVDAAKLVVVG